MLTARALTSVRNRVGIRSKSGPAFGRGWAGGVGPARMALYQRKKTHKFIKHKDICGIVLGLGGWQNFVYAFFEVIPCGEKKHKQNPHRIPGQPREKFVCVLFSSFVFVAPNCSCPGSLDPGLSPQPREPSLYRISAMAWFAANLLESTKSL